MHFHKYFWAAATQAVGVNLDAGISQAIHMGKPDVMAGGFIFLL